MKPDKNPFPSDRPDRRPPASATEPERLMTAREVAARLRVSLTWVTVHASGKHRPHLPSIKMGRSLRFRSSDIEAFVQACARKMAAGQPLY